MPMLRRCKHDVNVEFGDAKSETALVPPISMDSIDRVEYEFLSTLGYFLVSNR